MMNNKCYIDNYPFNMDDQLFFDTNIWLYIMGPAINPDKNALIYMSALEKIKQAGCKIYIDIIVLSEFINRYAKYLAMKQFNIDNTQFDKFKESKNFKIVTKAVSEVSSNILAIANRITSGFESIELSSILSRYSDNDANFNDQVIEQICISNQFKLVTHDLDFKRAKCDILSANYNLL